MSKSTQTSVYFSKGDQKEADETTGLVFFDLAQVNNLDHRYGRFFFSMASIPVNVRLIRTGSDLC